MRTAGIICECNPFHEGHRYLIEEARKNGAEAVICVMSGFFTQRGEPALMRPVSRAEAMLSYGADLVLSLPFPYCSSSAEYFASAGISILSRIGVDEVWFGSESGDSEYLTKLGNITADPAFAEVYAAENRNEIGTAEAFSAALRRFGGEMLQPPASNDLLAISYLRAIALQQSELQPRTVKRIGNAFKDENLSDSEFPSASALRKALQNGKKAEEILLPEVARVFRSESEKGRTVLSCERGERALLFGLSRLSVEEIDCIPGFSGGLGRRVLSSLSHASGYEDLKESVATKKYTDARISRGILFALTGVVEEDLRREVPWCRLLSANLRGRDFLAETRKNRKIPIVTKHADLPMGEDRQFLLESAAQTLWGTLCGKTVPKAEFCRLDIPFCQK